MRAVVAIVAVAISGLVLGCGSYGSSSSSSSSSSTSSSTIHVAKAQGSVKAQPGQAFAISFKTEPGVGFDWALSSNQPHGVVTLRSAHSVAANPGTVGGSETRTFVLRANRAGSAVLRFDHSFRGKARGSRTVHVTVSAGGG
jgi:predicted secreted protein